MSASYSTLESALDHSGLAWALGTFGREVPACPYVVLTRGKPEWLHRDDRNAGCVTTWRAELYTLGVGLEAERALAGALSLYGFAFSQESGGECGESTGVFVTYFITSTIG